MEKHVTLKDGTDVLIRPLTTGDVEKSFKFFKNLPSSDKMYLRSDVTHKEVVRERIRDLERNREKAIVAVSGDKIIADGSIESAIHGWKKHMAELRLIIARDFQRKGLGMIMARELYFMAASDKVQEIVVKMMRPQVGAQKIFKRLGFHEDITLPKYVRDLKGHRQDLIIMRCDLKSLWQELEDYFSETDWQRRK